MTIVVDDNKMDRYIVKRQLAKHPEFGDLMEATDGLDFLDNLVANGRVDDDNPKPVLILMDINMPGLNGFETAEKLQQRIDEGKGPESVVVMMFTSSDNPNDKARAEALDIVKGYIVKPLDAADIETLRPILER